MDGPACRRRDGSCVDTSKENVLGSAASMKVTPAHGSVRKSQAGEERNSQPVLFHRSFRLLSELNTVDEVA
jgi:hypothetical protein